MSSPILKSFTFVPQPKPSSDPLIIKRERMVARLEDQKKLLADPNFRAHREALGAQGRRREGACRETAAHIEVVAARSERRVRNDHEGRIEAHRVRKGQGGYCRRLRWRNCRV